MEQNFNDFVEPGSFAEAQTPLKQDRNFDIVRQYDVTSNVPHN